MKKIILLSFILAIMHCSFAQSAYKIEGYEVKTEKPIRFEQATAVLKAESDEALNIIKKYLEDKSYITLLRIEGHTDTDADADVSQSLSEKRALAVGIRLRELGVDCRRLIVVGFGGSKPVADNSTAAGKAENRRISFINVALRGRIIGGFSEDGGGRVAGKVCE
jgi:OmpA-OmpF porin, OOP family